MKNNITTLALATSIAAFSGNLLAMQPASFFSAQDKRTALIAIGAAAGTWGALEAGKALVSHFSKKPAIPTVSTEDFKKLSDNVDRLLKPVSTEEEEKTTQALIQKIQIQLLDLLDKQKTVNTTLSNFIENGALTPDATLAVHDLLVGYGLLTPEGNFATKNRNANGFLKIEDKIALITGCPKAIAALSTRLQKVENRLETLEKAQRTPTTATLPNIPDDTQAETNQYAALSETALEEALNQALDQQKKS